MVSEEAMRLFTLSRNSNTPRVTGMTRDSLIRRHRRALLPLKHGNGETIKASKHRTREQRACTPERRFPKAQPRIRSDHDHLWLQPWGIQRGVRFDYRVGVRDCWLLSSNPRESHKTGQIREALGDLTSASSTALT